MNEFVYLAAALAGGVLLGAIFFGGLWWTVIRGVSSERPALWFFGSILLRMGVTFGGFHLIARDHWERWLLCLLGFLLARVIVRWLTRPRSELHHSRAREGRYAP